MSRIARRRLEKVLAYIESHLEQSLSLVELANVADMSVSHFGRSFKMAAGVSTLKFVTIRRVSRANILLLDTDLSIAQVAPLSGFPGQSSFGKTSRCMTGITPAALRRNYDAVRSSRKRSTGQKSRSNQTKHLFLDVHNLGHG